MSDLAGITGERLAEVLKAGHRSIIREADEWRPLGEHVLGLIQMARKETREEQETCPDCTEAPMVKWCVACGHGMSVHPAADLLKAAAEALLLLKHRDVEGHPCWCFLWPDEEPHCEAKAAKDPNTHCARAQTVFAALQPYLK